MKLPTNKSVACILVLLLTFTLPPVIRAGVLEQPSDSRRTVLQKHEARVLDLARLSAARQTEDLVESGLFSNTSLFPPVVVEEIPRVASAPPLPFVFLGRITQDGIVTIFLAIGNRRLNVRAHDVLEGGSYRLKSLENDRLIFTYLPLKIDQELGIPNVQPR